MNLKDTQDTKQLRNLSILIFGFLAFLLILSIFNVYPGGYSIENETTESFSIEKTSFLKKENIEITITHDNELRAILLKSEITSLKILWIVSCMVILGFIFDIVSYISKNKKNMLFYITIVLLIIIIPLNVYLYLSKLNNIDSYLAFLNLS